MLVTLAKNRIAGVTSFIFRQIGRIACQSALLLVLLFVCGCSSFNREWRRAGQLPVAPNSIEGRWEGRWLSDANKHSGGLRCLISRQTNDTYSARFRATYQWIFRFSYTVSLTVKPQEGGWSFHGQEDLGALAGGVYHYEGNTTQTNFHSTYRSSADHGIFELKRLPQEK